MSHATAPQDRGSRNSSALLRGLIAAALLTTAPVLAQTEVNLDDDKKKAEIEKLEAERDKVMAEREKIAIDVMKGAATGTAGSGTVTAPELTAEGLMLSHYLQEQAAERLADHFARWLADGNGGRTGPVVIAFGDQPPSTAEYYALKGGIDRLRENLETAVCQWRAATSGPACEGEQMFAFPGVVSAITAITTVASLLKVDTTVAGAALASPNEQFKAVLLQELRSRGLPVDPPPTIHGEPEFASAALASLETPRDEAQAAYKAYLKLLKEKGGKVEDLTKPQAAAGASLATALGDYDALRKTLFTPVAGVLPAHVVDQQALLAQDRASRPIIYIHQQKGALTTTTKRGLLTGIVGIPAYVSGSLVVDYSFAGDKPASNALTVWSPTKRITDVRAWLASKAAEEAGKAAAGQQASGRP